MSIYLFYKKSSFFLSFAKFAGKHCWNLFCNEVAGLRPATLLKRRLQHRYFPVNIAKLLRTPILKNICERLFLYFRIVKKKNLFWKMKKWQIENSEKSEISEKLFWVFDFFLQRKSKTRIQKSWKKISEIFKVSEFSTWPI